MCDGRDVGLIELDRRVGQRPVGVAALAVHRRLVVGFEVGIDVRLFRGIRDAHRIRCRLGGFERVGDDERDVLAVIADDIVGQRRAALVAEAEEVGLEHRAVQLADVPAMQNRAHAGHFLGSGRVELLDAAVGDRGLDRHGVEHAGEMKVRRVLRKPGHLERPIHARRVAADR